VLALRRQAGAARGRQQRVVLERLKVYHRQSEPLVEYYRVRPTFRSINGAQAPDRWRPISARRSRRGQRRGGRERAVIVCRSAAELERMRAAGRLVGEVLTELRRTWRRA
jgi:hypothetical protein